MSLTTDFSDTGSKQCGPHTASGWRVSDVSLNRLVTLLFFCSCLFVFSLLLLKKQSLVPWNVSCSGFCRLHSWGIISYIPRSPCFSGCWWVALEAWVGSGSVVLQKYFLGGTVYFLSHWIGGRFITSGFPSFCDAKIDRWVQQLSVWSSIIKFLISFLHNGFGCHWWRLARSIISLGKRMYLMQLQIGSVIRNSFMLVLFVRFINVIINVCLNLL